MPMVFPNHGPGAGSAALDALRQVGSLDPARSGSRMGINDLRLVESNNWGQEPLAGLRKSKQAWAGERNDAA